MNMVISMSGQIPLHQLERLIEQTENDEEDPRLNAGTATTCCCRGEMLSRSESTQTRCYRRGQMLLREETANMLFMTLFSSIPKLFLQVYAFHLHYHRAERFDASVALYAGVISGYISFLMNDLINTRIVFKAWMKLRALQEPTQPAQPDNDQDKAFSEFKDAKHTFQKYFLFYIFFLISSVILVCCASIQTACDSGIQAACTGWLLDPPNSASDGLTFDGLPLVV
jgi:hypothetical protein